MHACLAEMASHEIENSSMPYHTPPHLITVSIHINWLNTAATNIDMS